jgi:hypothetical protein
LVQKIGPVTGAWLIAFISFTSLPFLAGGYSFSQWERQDNLGWLQARMLKIFRACIPWTPLVMWYIVLRLLGMPGWDAAGNGFLFGLFTIIAISTLVPLAAMMWPQSKNHGRTHMLWLMLAGSAFIVSLAVIIWGFAWECYGRIPAYLGGRKPVSATLFLKHDVEQELAQHGLTTPSGVDVLFRTDKLIYVQSCQTDNVRHIQTCTHPFVINNDDVVALSFDRYR